MSKIIKTWLTCVKIYFNYSKPLLNMKINWQSTKNKKIVLKCGRERFFLVILNNLEQMKFYDGEKIPPVYFKNAYVS